RWKLNRPTQEYWPQASDLVCARLSGLGGDELIIAHGASRRLHVMSRDGSEPSGAERVSGAASLRESISLATHGQPVAALKMRLNAHARDSLVVMQSGRSSPSVMFAQAGMTFTVNTTDDHDNGKCDAADCTLREAINAANANDGADMIVFNIVTTIRRSTP